ncbi:MAG: hypothetical protein ACYTG0_25355 [Planctomycetota bacterium]|jgi:hypothetical protein
MISLAPPLAQADDFIWVVVVIVFLIIGAVQQLLAKAREAQQKRQQQGQQPGPRQQWPAQQQGRPPGPGPVEGRPPIGDPLKREIDEFLGRGGPGAGPAGAEIQPAPPPRMNAPRQVPVDTEIELLEPLDDDAGVAEHVRSRIPTRKFGGLDSEVGEGLAHAEDRMEERLHGVFDHRVGSLAGTPGESAQITRPLEADAPQDRVDASPAVAAAGLAAALANPGDLRQAIIMSEILQRPQHRWT